MRGPWFLVTSLIFFLSLPTSVAREWSGERPDLSGFESIAEPLETRSDLMEADQDRCLALPFSRQRELSKSKKRLADAVRHYQRAFRYDPVGQVGSFVDCPFDQNGRLERRAASLSHAVGQSGSFGNRRRRDRRSGGSALAGKSGSEQSISLLQKLLDSRRDGSRSPVDLILHWRLAEWYHHTGKDSKAASAAEMVLAGLESPESFGMTQKMVDAFLAGSFDPFSVFGNYCLAAGDTRRRKRFLPNPTDAVLIPVGLRFDGLVWHFTGMTTSRHWKFWKTV